MTDMSGLRLWPLALMGWLAAYPPVSKDAPDRALAELQDSETERGSEARPGSRAAWLGAARARYAALSAEERARLRAERRAARQADLPRA